MKSDCTVIIAEKPDSSKKIAEALSGGKLKKIEKNQAFWFEFKRGSKKIIVVPAVGHLLVLDTVKKRGWSYPTFDVQWIPTYSKKGSEFTKKYFDNIQEVVKFGTDFIIATDYDTEGSVIGFNILNLLAGKKDAKRMKFSTLTKDELIDSFENANPHLDFPQVEAGLTRHYLDFFWGINLTRALTLSMKNISKGFSVLSTGRVQGPTLSILLEKEMEIRKFKPTPYWQLELHVEIGNEEIVASYEKERLLKEEEADKIVTTSKGNDAVVKDIEKKQYQQLQPVPFNTTDLQAEAYFIFKFSPTQTMSIAESLYQAGIISYPRSSSQKLPPSINYQKILRALSSLSPYNKFAKEILSKKEIKPNEGARDDPAHPAIYPTFEVADLKRLSSQQKKIYDLVVRRFLSVFSDPAIREVMNVILDVDGNNFIAVGKRTIEKGWTKIYEPYLDYEEQILPELKIGQVLKVLKLEKLEKETQPPGRYSQGSILKEMEKRELGTRATRAEILKTLYDRGYISGQSIKVTKLGEVVTEALKEYSPKILSEEMTRKFESEMDLVLNGKKKREEVVEEAKETLTEVLEDFKKNEKEIGKRLYEGLVEARKEENRLGMCPKCKTGELRMMFSRKTGKRFVGCSNYPKCVNGFPLPQVGLIIPLGKTCDKCGLPMIQVNRKRRRPFRMCINHKCVSKEGWGKRKKRVKQKLINE
ncbi:MAG: DNA topoisomerase I [Candidatus Aenigmatarchaeota archaeon]